MSVTYTFQWQRSTDNVTWVDIGGASGTFVDTPAFTETRQYVLAAADDGDYVRLKVTDGTTTWYSTNIGPVSSASGASYLDLDYESGQSLKSNGGDWDANEISGSGGGTGVTVVTPSAFAGHSHDGQYTITPGNQTVGGLHIRALSRIDRSSFAVNPGTHVFNAFSVRFPSGYNSDNFSNARMVSEFIHNDNGVVHSTIAPIGIFIHEPAETWQQSSQSYGVPGNTSTPSLVLRVCGGYVPNQQPGGGKPTENQAYWHPNIIIPGFQPVPLDTNIHIIAEVDYHQGAGASPAGGYNIHSSPMFNGADSALGTVRIWTATGNPTSATDFTKRIDMTACVPTLVYGDDGAGNVLNDAPYGPFIGLYDSFDTIGYTARVLCPYYGVKQTFADAVAALV